MKKLIALFTVAALFAFKPVADTWNVDNAHSKLGFSISHMMVSDVEGSFKTFTATITASKEDFTDAVVELSADVASVNTDNDRRDNHLKAPEYFDAAQHPKLTFKSTSFKKVADKKYKVAGNLTLKGITKPVTLDATMRGPVKGMQGKTIVGFKVTGTINRKDFDIAAKAPAAMLGEEITLNANTEFVK